jgi:beta-phosphoglucomutase-like phosphatase (HAD superfamily)
VSAAAEFRGLRALLLDADGSLFPSEEPAFTASADVTNRFLASLGVPARMTPERLLATATGRNFRATALDLALAAGVPADASLRPPADTVSHAGTAGRANMAGYDGARGVLTETVLDWWVDEENRVVSDYLAHVLRPDPAVLEPVRRLAGQYQVAAVSSSALSRLDACFRATGLDGLIPAECRFSAEDSLPRPASKPRPDVYRLAGDRLQVTADQALAVEDSVPGVQAAVGAGFPALGNLTFVPPAERPGRRAALTRAGATRIAESWYQIEDLLLPPAALAACSTWSR